MQMSYTFGHCVRECDEFSSFNCPVAFVMWWCYQLLRLLIGLHSLSTRTMRKKSIVQNHLSYSTPRRLEIVVYLVRMVINVNVYENGAKNLNEQMESANFLCKPTV